MLIESTAVEKKWNILFTRSKILQKWNT
jgi:hypothetical protein